MKFHWYSLLMHSWCHGFGGLKVWFILCCHKEALQANILEKRFQEVPHPWHWHGCRTRPLLWKHLLYGRNKLSEVDRSKTGCHHDFNLWQTSLCNIHLCFCTFIELLSWSCAFLLLWKRKAMLFATLLSSGCGTFKSFSCSLKSFGMLKKSKCGYWLCQFSTCLFQASRTFLASSTCW